VQSLVKGLSSCVFFICLFYLAPPRQVEGRDPRDALDRHPSADPRRWHPAGGPVAGADLAVCPPTASGINDPTWLTATRLWLAITSCILCLLSTAVGTTPGASGTAADPWQAVNNILSTPHAFVETGHGAGYEPRHEDQAPNC
jgi:hypothetical protein